MGRRRFQSPRGYSFGSSMGLKFPGRCLLSLTTLRDGVPPFMMAACTYYSYWCSVLPPKNPSSAQFRPKYKHHTSKHCSSLCLLLQPGWDDWNCLANSSSLWWMTKHTTVNYNSLRFLGGLWAKSSTIQQKQYTLKGFSLISMCDKYQ